MSDEFTVALTTNVDAQPAPERKPLEEWASSDLEARMVRAFHQYARGREMTSNEYHAALRAMTDGAVAR